MHWEDAACTRTAFPPQRSVQPGLLPSSPGRTSPQRLRERTGRGTPTARAAAVHATVRSRQQRALCHLEGARCPSPCTPGTWVVPGHPCWSELCLSPQGPAAIGSLPGEERAGPRRSGLSSASPSCYRPSGSHVRNARGHPVQGHGSLGSACYCSLEQHRFLADAGLCPPFLG